MKNILKITASSLLTIHYNIIIPSLISIFYFSENIKKFPLPTSVYSSFSPKTKFYKITFEHINMTLKLPVA